jgi:hypothetical protein
VALCSGALPAIDADSVILGRCWIGAVVTARGAMLTIVSPDLFSRSLCAGCAAENSDTSEEFSPEVSRCALLRLAFAQLVTSFSPAELSALAFSFSSAALRASSEGLLVACAPAAPELAPTSAPSEGITMTAGLLSGKAV